MKGIGLILFSLLWLAFTAGMSYEASIKASQQKEAHTSYQAVDARVLSSKVVHHSSRSNGKKRSSYRPEISYTYTVDGKNYTSSRYFYTGLGASENTEAEDIVRRYPAGQTVTAYYKPSDPSEVVLNNALPPEGGLIAFMAVFWLIGFLMLGFGIRQGFLKPKTAPSP